VFDRYHPVGPAALRSIKPAAMPISPNERARARIEAAVLDLIEDQEFL
jgi:hypothetical protein